MKIRTCAALLIALLSLSILAGCGAKAAEVPAMKAVEAPVTEAKLPEEPVVPVTEAPKAELPAPVPEATLPVPKETVPAVRDPEPVKPAPAAAPPAEKPAQEKITEAEAKAIALKHAGLTEAQVQRLTVRYDINDRIPEYDVEFHEGYWEYEYEIHAQTGAILSWDRDD